jgi:hypothetical protein
MRLVKEGSQMRDHDAFAAIALSAKIAALLGGHPAAVQGAALADCLAIWLAGHWCEGEAERHDLREELLTMHLEKVRELIPVNEEILTRDKKTPERS